MFGKEFNIFKGFSTLVTCVNPNGMSAVLMRCEAASSKEAFPTDVTLMVTIIVLLGCVVGTIIVIHVDETIGIMVKVTVLDKKARGLERFIAVPAFINVSVFGSRNPGVDINQVCVDNSW
jgi:hypothetical protein